MKKKRILIVVIILLILLLLASAFAWLRQKSYQQYIESLENQYLLNISVASSTENSFYGPLPASYHVGQDRPISFSVTNNSYVPIQIREVLILSVYDQAGNPVAIDGTPYTASSLDVVSQNEPLTKALERNQAVYTSEYLLEAGNTPAKTLFGSSNPENHYKTRDYSLTFADNNPYSQHLIRMDLLLFAKPQDYPYADWELMSIQKNILETDQQAFAEDPVFSGSVLRPTFSTNGQYHWELDQGKALLVDIGTVQETDIVIPNKIWLSSSDQGLVEDPIFGTCYQVQVKGDAFNGNTNLQTVTFRDGVSVAHNAMWDGRQGMFSNCTSLTAVYNIPDSVTSMKKAFFGCTSLSVMPELPESVSDLTSCFQNCQALAEVTDLPANVTSLNRCFLKCDTLTATPVFPDGLTDMSGAFSGCSSLTYVQPIPDSVKNMDNAFYNCTALQQFPNFPTSLLQMDSCFQNCQQLDAVPPLPDTVISMRSTFANCTALDGITALPTSVIYLDKCFYQCESLTVFPSLPDQYMTMEECFYGCSQLSGNVTLPNRVVGDSLFPARLENVFGGCTSLSSITIACCENVVTSDNISDSVPVSFGADHTGGICEGCHYANGTFAADGITLYMDNVPADLCQVLMDFVESEVPDKLKACCNRLTFTSNTTLLGGKDNSGIYYYGNKQAYIAIVSMADSQWVMERLDLAEDNTDFIERYKQQQYSSYNGVIYHELAHGFDASSGTLSASSRWQQLHNQEKATFALALAAYPASEARSESFARAVSRYFVDPENLQQNAPGMYAYIDEIFGEAA